MRAHANADRHLNLPLLLPLLASSVLMQIVVPLIRVATSYRAIELGFSVAQIGMLSSAFALLPVIFAVHIGRHNDRHGEGGTALFGAILVAVAVLGLWLWSFDFFAMFCFNCILGIGQVMSISAQQMITTRCSGPEQHDRVLGMFLVANGVGQAVGPLIIGLTTPAGALYPDMRLYWLVAGLTVACMICALALKAGLPTQAAMRKAPPVSVRAILRTPGLIAILLASSLCLATNDLLLVFFPVLGEARGIDAATVGVLLSLRAVTSMVSRLVFARLLATIGKLPLMMVALMATGLATGLLVLDMPMWSIGLALAASGFTMGLAIACSLSLNLAMAPAGGKATALSLRLTVSRFGQFALPLAAGMTATVLGPGSIFAIVGLSLFGCGTMIRRVPRPD